MDLLKKVFTGDKKLQIAIIAGFIGIMLIAASAFFPAQKQVEVKNIKIDEYKKLMTDDVTNLVESIAGKSTVMLSFAQGEETVYANDEKHSDDSYERNAIIIDNNGDRQVAVKTVRLPTILGVAVVCKGGDDIIIEQKLTDALTTVLGISSTKVKVVGSQVLQSSK